MKGFLAVSDDTPEQLQNLLDLALKLKTKWPKWGNVPLLKGRVLETIFQNPSLHSIVCIHKKLALLICSEGKPG